MCQGCLIQSKQKVYCLPKYLFGFRTKNTFCQFLQPFPPTPRHKQNLAPLVADFLHTLVFRFDFYHPCLCCFTFLRLFFFFLLFLVSLTPFFPFLSFFVCYVCRQVSQFFFFSLFFCDFSYFSGNFFFLARCYHASYRL